MRKTLLLFVLVAIIVGITVAANRLPNDGATKENASPQAEFGVGALGRLEPQSEVLVVNAPSVMEPPVVEKLHVVVGEHVEARKILAVLDSHNRELADLEQAKAAVLLSEKTLAQVKAGAKAGDILAQSEQVERTREQLRLAEKQLERGRKLSEKSALSDDDFDLLISDVEVLQRELLQHEASLSAIREVRPVDVELAEADVLLKKAALLRAEADLEISLIRSPIDAEILRINTRVGERIGSEGLLELGDTRQMDVVAEVHESDILKVEEGQPATIFIRNLDTTLSGHVIEVGRVVGRKDVLSNDPVDDTDARVIEVRIRLDDEHGRLVSGMSYAKVEVTIDTSQSALSSENTADAQISRKE